MSCALTLSVDATRIANTAGEKRDRNIAPGSRMHGIVKVCGTIKKVSVVHPEIYPESQLICKWCSVL